MKISFRVLSLIVVIGLTLSGVGPASAANTWAVGNLVGLCAGTQIHTGSGDSYFVHTIVPENNWTVKVIDGPRTVNGQTWWDTSRKAAGDPSGGTGWVKQSEADNCSSGGGGGGSGGAGGGGETGGGVPPVPPTYSVTLPCEAAQATHGEFGVLQPDNKTKKEHFIVLTIPEGEVQTDKVYTSLPDLDAYSQRIGAEPVSQWTIQSPNQEITNMPELGEREWRILVPGRVVDYWVPFVAPYREYGGYKRTWLDHPGDMVYLMCKREFTPTMNDEFLVILNGLAIVSPTPGARLSYQVEIPSWMSWIQTSIRKASDAKITLISPDGTIYSPTSSAVTYTNTPGFAVHTLNLRSPQGGTWQVIIDVIAAESDSVFMLDVNGKQYNDPSNDNIPPITGMHFDGEKGKNGWFTSNVTVTLSAEDNPGGSGVQGIEWSTDDGTTWQPYTGPFIVGQEGISYLLGRSYDNQGNYELSPIGKFLSIDKNPPVVIITTDNSEYTRVQPFIVHYSGYDPEPGSGLMSLNGTFNQQPVTNGQSVDMFWWSLDQYTLSVTGEDYAGWTMTESKSIQLVATIESLQQTVKRLCKEKYITKSGICNSLQSKLNSALAAQKRGKNKTAVNVLLAFQKEVKAQTGKAIKPKASTILIMDSNYVIRKLGGK